MQNIIKKRDFKYVIFLLVHILLFYLIYTYFQQAISNIKNQMSSLHSLYDKVQDKQYTSYFLQEESLKTQFATLYLISGSIILYLLLKAKNNANYIVVFLFFFIIIYTIYPFKGGFSIPIEPKEYTNLEYYSYYYSFLPYIYLVVNYSIFGIKVDVSKQVQQKEEDIHNDITDDLDKLFKLNLLSREEYLNKKEKHLKEKIRTDLKKTEEYELLLKSRQKGLLTEEEFNLKFENLVSINYDKKLTSERNFKEL